jgi:hypothetical protein
VLVITAVLLRGGDGLSTCKKTVIMLQFLLFSQKSAGRKERDYSVLRGVCVFDQCEAHPAEGGGEDGFEDAQVLDGVAALALPPAPGGLLVGGGAPGLPTPSTPLYTRSYSPKQVCKRIRTVGGRAD